jgi:hypothetical protein
MNYPKRFFEINLLFAQKFAEISRQALESTLLYHTNLYIRFGLGWDLVATNTILLVYLEGLHQAEDTAEWTYVNIPFLVPVGSRQIQALCVAN